MKVQAERGRGNASPSMRAVEAIETARTGYDIFKALKGYLPDFRMSFFAVFVQSEGGRTDLEDRVVLTNWDSEVIHRCLEKDFYHWPFTSGLRSSVLPRSVVLDDYLMEETDPGYRDLALFLRSGGQHAFVHLPAHSSTGRKGAVSFSGARELVGGDEVMKLDFVAQHAFEKLMHIFAESGDRANPLSEREAECLKAAARGFNSVETADQLGITVHTVNYHLGNAQKKLDARNKTQAVAQAIRNGWLGRS
jgi:DNA-binding CsgD family transcriptional regulator